MYSSSYQSSYKSSGVSGGASFTPMIGLYFSRSPNQLDHYRPILPVVCRSISEGHWRSILQCEFRSMPSNLSHILLHSGKLQWFLDHWFFWRTYVPSWLGWGHDGYQDLWASSTTDWIEGCTLLLLLTRRLSQAIKKSSSLAWYPRHGNQLELGHYESAPLGLSQSLLNFSDNNPQKWKARLKASLADPDGMP